jgi:hypothetical protein
MTLRTKIIAPVLILALAVMGGTARAQDAAWPDLSSPPKQGGGEKDAAVIIGAEKYPFVEHVPGARQNAEDWQAYLTDGLKVPFDKVHLLRDEEATLEEMRDYAKKAASEVGEGGTLWFVFIGHGAASQDQKDGLLVGIDAQQRADSLFARSLSRSALLSLLSKGVQSKTVVLIDACFSGKTSSGRDLVNGLQPLANVMSKPMGVDDRTILLTAGRSDQFAGPLPKAGKMRPAFSYLALGALRGWAAGENGKVTAGDLIQFADSALKLAHDRTQTPELAAGSPAAVLGRGRETPPDLGKLDRQEARAAAASAAPPAETAAEPAAEPVLDAESLAARRKAAEEARQKRIAARSGLVALDLDALREAAADYRQRAALLRRSVGIRQRSISDAESRAAQIVAAAQADAARQQQEAVEAQQKAQSNQQTAQIFGTLLGAFGGSLGSNLGKAIQAGSRIASQAAQNQAAGANAGMGAAGAAGSQEVYQAQRDAAPLRDQANKLEGDKKRLALKADQYERLADAKDLLIAAETLRLQSEDEAVAAESADKTIASAKSLVEHMDIW